MQRGLHVFLVLGLLLFYVPTKLRIPPLSVSKNFSVGPGDKATLFVLCLHFVFDGIAAPGLLPAYRHLQYCR